MIWSLEFKDKKSKQWFEKKYKKVYELRLIHHHYEKEFGYKKADFFYDAGYLGYAEAEMIVGECKKNGVVKFKQLYLCDIKFKEVCSSE